MKNQGNGGGKQAAGIRAAGMVEDGSAIGLGTGSTVLYAMEEISRRISEGMRVTGVPTSHQAAIRARAMGIPLATLDDFPVLDLAIDGADQVDPSLRLIKGRGAALTREKCVADAARRLVIVADEAKMVSCLDAVVPVEVIPFAVTPVSCAITALGGTPVVREGMKKDGPVITDNGNFIIDCAFGRIPEPARLESMIEALPGVLSCGIFSGYAGKTVVIVGGTGGCRILSP
ncbi:ribose 5-phosphate isomerase A [Methanolinea mesophila]|uniref:ribose-5-phosphate isomerase RpiA n=1 Tax=Methanolinea mesophila TaxID=547055 RepID=UPI001AE91E36|nr:ribose-5-phosphate isomerase RpiA [Methanolinea mesophila]MBP1928200.1 ribose 5-phosphate isomerase A [Methanolinea mesophila]